MSKEKSVKERLLSYENIYLAIYALNSSGINEFLLDKDDYLKFLKLSDKFNQPLLETEINRVKDQLEKILDNKDYYFETKVFFNPKGTKEEVKGKKHTKTDSEYNYRPLHTSSITNQIAMISMLNILIYDIDKSNKISISEMGKLLPDNFYGNRVAKQPELLFKPWIHQYKKYCDNSNDLLMTYKENKEFKYEIDFDIKNFFPSINPLSLYNYIIGLLPIYYSKSDMITLTTIIKKLIFLKVVNINLNENNTSNLYYDEYKPQPDEIPFALGIAQGLPHTYFFANLFMIEVKEIYEKQFDKSKMLFYVDDSIIFTTGKDAKKQIKINDIYSADNNEIIKSIEAEIKEILVKYEEPIEVLKNYEIKNDEIVEFVSNNINSFAIKLHQFATSEEGNSKSSITEIKDSMDFGGFLARQTSIISGSINKLFDEDSDNIMYERTKIILELVHKELENQKKEKDDIATAKSYNSDKYKKYLRYQKLFTNRAKNLSLIINGDINKVVDVILDKLTEINSQEDDIQFIDKFFTEYSETTLITDVQSIIKASFRFNVNIGVIKNILLSIDNRIFGRENKDSSYIYKILSLADFAKEINTEYKKYGKYNTLETIVGYKLGISYNKNKRTKNYILENEIATFFEGANIIDDESTKNTYITGSNNYSYMDEIAILNNKTKFIDSYFNSYYDKHSACFSKMAILVLSNSDLLYRMLFNSIVSYLSQIDILDSFSITKNDNILIHYYELRLLVFLRSKSFNLDKFEAHYKECMKAENNREIDYSILQVLKIFSQYVKDPDQIDILILTHKYISDIWKNGSKQLYFYTLHNQDHAIELIKNSIKLTKVIDFLQIKPIDYYILFLACYLHDISMVTIPNYDSLQGDTLETNLIYSDFMDDFLINIIDKDSQGIKKKLKEYYLRIDQYYENLVRSNHGKDSSKEILQRSTLSFIDVPIKSFVSQVSLAHVSSDAEIYDSKSVASDNVISLKYMKILLRLADLLDMGCNRVTDLLLTHNLDNMNEITRFHWLSHSITKGYSIKNSYYIDNSEEPNLFIHHNVCEKITLSIYVDLLQFTPMKNSYGCCKMCLMSNEEREKERTFEKDKSVKLSSFLYESDLYKNSKKNDFSYNDNLFHKDIELKINDKVDSNKCSGKCNFLCNWIVIKNEYLFNELFALQTYLQSLPNNLFSTKFYVKVKLINQDVLNNKEFNYLKEYINKKNEEKNDL